MCTWSEWIAYQTGPVQGRQLEDMFGYLNCYPNTGTGNLMLGLYAVVFSCSA